jgi:hypothetical protein
MRKELIQKTIITETKVILLDLGTGKGQVPNTYQKREDYYKDKDTIVLPQDKDLSFLLDGPLFHFFESIVAPEWKANPERFQYDLNVDLLSLEPETFKIMEEFHVTHVTLFNVVQYIEYKGVLRLIQHCISKGICLVMYGPVHDQYDNEEANVTLTERPIDVTQPQNRGRAKYLIKLTEPDGNVYEEFYYPKALWNKFGLQAGWSGSAMEFWKQFGTGIAYSMKEYRRRHILYFHPVITFDLIRAELKAKDETKVLTSQAKILDYNNLPEIKKSLLTMHRKMDVYPKKNGILVRIYGSYCYDRRGAVYELSSQEKIYGYGELLLDSSQSYILHPLKLNQISNYRVLAPRRTFVKWFEGASEREELLENQLYEGLIFDTSTQALQDIYVKPYLVQDLKLVQVGKTYLAEGHDFKLIRFVGQVLPPVSICECLLDTSTTPVTAVIIGIREDKTYADETIMVESLIELYQTNGELIRYMFESHGVMYPSFQVYANFLREKMPKNSSLIGLPNVVI